MDAQERPLLLLSLGRARESDLRAGQPPALNPIRRSSDTTISEELSFPLKQKKATQA